MLQNVKLVVDDPALRHPLLQALSERFPHVHTCGSNRTSLKCTQVLLEKLIQPLFLAFPTKPQRFSRLQVGHDRQKLLLLPQVDLIDSHLSQRRSASRSCPALQIPQIDRPHRTRCQAKLPRHSSYRCALTGLPHRLLKALAEGRLAGQRPYFLGLDPAVRTAHSIQLDHHRRAIL